MNENQSSILTAFRGLECVHSAEIVGSYVKGKEKPKDVDILIQLSIDDATLMNLRRIIKRDMVKIIKSDRIYLPIDIFLITSDRKQWRLRPWQDMDTGITTYEWE